MVGVGHPLELPLAAAAGGDVAQVQDAAVAARPDRGGGLELAGLAALTDDAEVQHGAAGPAALSRGADQRAVLGVDEVEQRAVVGSLGQQAEHVAGGRRGEQQLQVGVDDRDAVGLDSTRLRKSSSLRTRSSVSRLSSRMRRPRRTAIRASTTAMPRSPPLLIARPCRRLCRTASGTPSIANTTGAIPQGLTRGAAARALRSASEVGAQEAARDDGLQAQGDRDIGHRRPHHGRRDVGHGLGAGGRRLAGDGGDHHPVAERRGAAVETVHSVPAPPSMTAA